MLCDFVVYGLCGVVLDVVDDDCCVFGCECECVFVFEFVVCVGDDDGVFVVDFYVGVLWILRW